MVAEAEVMHQAAVPVLEVQYHRCVAKGIEEVVGMSAAAAVTAPAEVGVEVDVATEVLDMGLEEPDAAPSVPVEMLQFVPNIRSGSFADTGPRRYMEDEHIRIDDLSAHLGSLLVCPLPSAFYGVFDGHGGPDAAAYMKRHAMRFLFEDSEFPQASQVDEIFLQSVENSVRRAFLQADLALADDLDISRSSGTTALAALVFGRQLLVANAGDCRAVLCRKGIAMEMSRDHRANYVEECERVAASGGYIEDGYLNGVLSVTRALGDWDMKTPDASTSSLIAEPEFQQTMLTDDDEFLIMGCDGIWDVMTSQHAVSIVRRGLRQHDDPERCARELVVEAKRLQTADNLTVIVVCFVPELSAPQQEQPARPRSCKSLSAEALCNLRSWLETDHR
ncbi:probable protein phosphatase 2C 47 [Phragmites australis]|uniref:probable protein phosphatase 2C 47 n=1 Tax=Phragmites australis TaxID=29695 RepID=UPI002D783E10|nr:probable protein phosphatase 2C 47 [Phragmites australis]